MNKCMVCGEKKLLFWCRKGEIVVIACIECVIKLGLKILEEVKLDKKRLEDSDSPEG